MCIPDYLTYLCNFKITSVNQWFIWNDGARLLSHQHYRQAGLHAGYLFKIRIFRNNPLSQGKSGGLAINYSCSFISNPRCWPETSLVDSAPPNDKQTIDKNHGGHYAPPFCSSYNLVPVAVQAKSGPIKYKVNHLPTDSIWNTVPTRSNIMGCL